MGFEPLDWMCFPSIRLSSVSLVCSQASEGLWRNSHWSVLVCQCMCVYFCSSSLFPSPLLCTQAHTQGGTQCARLCSLGRSRHGVCVFPVCILLCLTCRENASSSFFLHETLWVTGLSSDLCSKASYITLVSFPVFTVFIVPSLTLIFTLKPSLSVCVCLKGSISHLPTRPRHQTPCCIQNSYWIFPIVWWQIQFHQIWCSALELMVLRNSVFNVSWVWITNGIIQFVLLLLPQSLSWVCEMSVWYGLIEMLQVRWSLCRCNGVV